MHTGLQNAAARDYPDATPPRAEAHLESVLRTIRERNGRLNDQCGRLERLADSLYGEVPQPGDKTGPTQVPSGLMGQIMKADQWCEATEARLDRVINRLINLA